MPKALNKDMEILQLISQGNTAKKIAARFNVSHRTIEDRIDKLKYTHEAKNLPHLVMIAIKKKLINLK